MEFLIKRRNLFLIGILLISMACCLTLSIYKLSVSHERDECFAQLAKEYNADPTFNSIGNAILTQIQPNLVTPKLTRDETHSVLAQIAPIRTVIQGNDTDGEMVELVFIHVCKYPENSLTYSVNYSKEGFFREIRLYWDD